MNTKKIEEIITTIQEFTPKSNEINWKSRQFNEMYGKIPTEYKYLDEVIDAFIEKLSQLSTGENGEINSQSIAQWLKGINKSNYYKKELGYSGAKATLELITHAIFGKHSNITLDEFLKIEKGKVIPKNMKFLEYCQVPYYGKISPMHSIGGILLNILGVSNDNNLIFRKGILEKLEKYFDENKQNYENIFEGMYSTEAIEHIKSEYIKRKRKNKISQIMGTRTRTVRKTYGETSMEKWSDDWYAYLKEIEEIQKSKKEYTGIETIVTYIPKQDPLNIFAYYEPVIDVDFSKSREKNLVTQHTNTKQSGTEEPHIFTTRLSTDTLKRLKEAQLNNTEEKVELERMLIRKIERQIMSEKIINETGVRKIRNTYKSIPPKTQFGTKDILVGEESEIWKVAENYIKTQGINIGYSQIKAVILKIIKGDKLELQKILENCTYEEKERKQLLNTISAIKNTGLEL